MKKLFLALVLVIIISGCTETTTTTVPTTTIETTTTTTSSSTTSSSTTTTTSIDAVILEPSSPDCGDGICDSHILTQGDLWIVTFYDVEYNVTLQGVPSTDSIVIKVNSDMESMDKIDTKTIEGLRIFVQDVYLLGTARFDNQAKLFFVEDPLNCAEDCGYDLCYPSDTCHPDGCVVEDDCLCTAGVGDCDSDDDCIGTDIVCCALSGPYYGCDSDIDMCLSQSNCAALVAPPAYSPSCGDASCQYTEVFNQTESKLLSLNGAYYNVTLNEVPTNNTAIVKVNEQERTIAENNTQTISSIEVYVGGIHFFEADTIQNYATVYLIENPTNCPADC